MLELVQVMKDGICDHPEVERLMLELAMQLETVKGKKSYGYLPKPQKKLVDRIVDEMERLPSVRDCYDQWMVLQGKWMDTKSGSVFRCHSRKNSARSKTR